MIKKLFGKINITQRIIGVIKPRRKLTGVLNATRAKMSMGDGIMAGHFMPSLFGAFGFAGTPVSYQKLIDSEGYTLIDSEGYTLKTKERDETIWQ